MHATGLSAWLLCSSSLNGCLFLGRYPGSFNCWSMHVQTYRPDYRSNYRPDYRSNYIFVGIQVDVPV
jgi:hypothetical protein